MFYTGIGCRDRGISIAHREAMETIGFYLATLGMVLRSGHASGCDEAFEVGASEVDVNKTSIYLPWESFRDKARTEGVNYYTLDSRAFKWARKQLIRAKVSPDFDNLLESTQAFYARNVFQVLGKEKVKSDFVVYYAPVDGHGNVLGGTRIAVELARKLGVPTYNLRDNTECMLFLQYLDHLHGARITKEVHKLYEKLQETR